MMGHQVKLSFVSYVLISEPAMLLCVFRSGEVRECIWVLRCDRIITWLSDFKVRRYLLLSHTYD